MSKPIAVKKIMLDGKEVVCHVYRSHRVYGCDTFKKTPRIRWKDTLMTNRSRQTEMKTRDMHNTDEGGIRSEWE